MNPYAIIRILCVLLLVLCGAMATSIPIAFLLGEPEVVPSFLYVIVPAAIVCLILFRLLERADHNLSLRDGFVLVASSWVAASLLGSLPMMLSGAIPSYTDAFFETMSGFTTTGASILTEIEHLPRTVLYWRSLTHWLGGMGIVVLTVAIFPVLGIRGMKLVKAEAPWPTVDKVTPRISQTAKILWVIYIGLTVIEIVLLMMCGMNLFDAATHTFGTLATGGFSPRNTSVGAYNSAAIDIIITIFMLLAGTNFFLYYRFLTGKFTVFFRNSEFRLYVFVFGAATVVLTAVLWSGGVYDAGNSFRYAAFQVSSILTTTGFATADFNLWPESGKVILVLLMFIGGCAGSTGGGIKVSRIYVLVKQGVNEVRRLVHPHGVYSVRMSGEPVKREIVMSIMIFFFLYIGFLLITTFLGTFAGTDVFTAFISSLAILGNIGPGLGPIGPIGNYAFFPDWMTWWFSFVMMAGRLELFTVLVAIAAIVRRS